MSRLKDLYKAMETFEREGLPVNEELKNKANELEEELIKNEILPIITDNIRPALEEVQRELVLVVDYIPGKPISVHLSRKRKLADIITDAKEITADPIVEHTSYGKYKIVTTKKSAAKKIKITFANGKVIKEHFVADTLFEFVKYVGIERVRNLNIIVSRIPLISSTLDEKYASQQKPFGNGYYLMTNTSTLTKIKEINYIANKLGIELIVEIV